ncbi:MAG TPA: hypothetical protein PK230_02315 [Chitinophagales bacterium]|nr:hypothetical protein [Chitinophagales bacterium]
MSYSQFTSLNAVIEHFGLVEPNPSPSLFAQTNALAPSPLLNELLTYHLKQKTTYFSEKSRSEALVFPILLELQRQHEHQIALYSGANIEADKEQGLNGECDFVLAKGGQSYTLRTPIFCVVEAKDNDMKLGLPQCVAQMVGVQYFNDKKQQQLPAVYGCVTTGRDWLFLRLQQKTLVIDDTIYSIENLPRLLGVLEDIVQQFID